MPHLICDNRHSYYFVLSKIFNQKLLWWEKSFRLRKFIARGNGVDLINQSLWLYNQHLRMLVVLVEVRHFMAFWKASFFLNLHFICQLFSVKMCFDEIFGVRVYIMFMDLLNTPSVGARKCVIYVYLSKIWCSITLYTNFYSHFDDKMVVPNASAKPDPGESASIKHVAFSLRQTITSGKKKKR